MTNSRVPEQVIDDPALPLAVGIVVAARIVLL
jgi:hypothetical protein